MASRRSSLRLAVIAITVVSASWWILAVWPPGVRWKIDLNSARLSYYVSQELHAAQFDARASTDGEDVHLRRLDGERMRGLNDPYGVQFVWMTVAPSGEIIKRSEPTGRRSIVRRAR